MEVPFAAMAPLAIPPKSFVPRPLQLAISALIFIGVVAAMSVPESTTALLVLGAVVLALAIIGITALRRRRGTLLQCESLPVQIGHPFRGHVEIRSAKVPSDGFWLVLRCTEVKQGSEDIPPVTVWQDELLVDAIQVPGGLRVPFAFDMPIEAKPSAQRIKWTLEISASGHAAEFPLPVVRSRTEPVVADELVRPFATVRDSLRS